MNTHTDAEEWNEKREGEKIKEIKQGCESKQDKKKQLFLLPEVAD